MNSRKKAQKAQKNGSLVNYLKARPSALEGSRFAVLQLYRLAAGGSRERSRGHHLPILTYIPTTQQRCVSNVSIFALFTPFCGY
jgi:hypothetical protein